MSVEVTRLPSGLTVVTDSMPHLQTASLGVWVGSGSRDEQPDEHGISHLLEHMAFKGTKRRTARQIAEEIEAVGGDLNAATSFETTAYFASVLKTDMPLAVDVLSDILSNPTFDPAELKREQNVIVQEIGATEDTPDDLVFDYLQATAFPEPADRPRRSSARRKPCARSRSSTCAPISRATIARPTWWWRRPARSITPPWSPRSSGASASSTARPRRCRSRRRFGGGTKLEARDLEQVHIALALEGLAQRHADYFSLQVFTIVLGGGMSSRLFQEVREKRGLCYTISAFHAPYADTGMFGIYAGTDAGDVKELMRVAVEETAAAAGNITEAEVNRAKAQIKVGLLMALESSGARARQLANQILIYGRPLPIEEMVARIENVSVESTRAAGAALMARARPADRGAWPRQGP